MSARRQIIPTTVLTISGGTGSKTCGNGQRTFFKEIQRDPCTYPGEMEIESFIHGAMCISYSGRCLLSNFLQEEMPIREPVHIRAAGNIPWWKRRDRANICRYMRMKEEPIFSTPRICV